MIFDRLGVIEFSIQQSSVVADSCQNKELAPERRSCTLDLEPYALFLLFYPFISTCFFVFSFRNPQSEIRNVLFFLLLPEIMDSLTRPAFCLGF